MVCHVTSQPLPRAFVLIRLPNILTVSWAILQTLETPDICRGCQPWKWLDGWMEGKVPSIFWCLTFSKVNAFISGNSHGTWPICGNYIIFPTLEWDGIGYVLASSTSSALGWQGEGHISTPSRRHIAMMHSASHRTKKLSQGHQRKSLVAKPLWFCGLWDLSESQDVLTLLTLWLCFCTLLIDRKVGESSESVTHFDMIGANQHSNHQEKRMQNIGINPIKPSITGPWISDWGFLN